MVTQKGFIGIVTLISFLLIVILIGAHFYPKEMIDNQKNYRPTQINVPQTTPPDASETTDPTKYPQTDYQIKRIYTSTNGDYFFNVSINASKAGEGSSTNQCEYALVSKMGTDFDLSEIIETPTLPCDVGMGMMSVPLFDWVSNNTFALEEEEGNIKLVSLPDLQVTSYNYDSVKFGFMAVSDSLKYWLFVKKSSPEDKSSFIILGNDEKVILDNLEFNQTDNEHVLSVLFDTVNQGFLFTTRNYFRSPEHSNSMTFVKFDFLELSTLKIRNILTTKPIEAPGRDCGGYDELSSIPGEIIVSIPCITVADKYLDQDYKIHIKL